MSMGKIHLIMPMAGRGSRFSNAGYDYPKPLLRIYDKPFFYWATQSVAKFNELASLHFVVLQEHIDKFNIDEEILKYYPNANIHVLKGVTEGAVITCCHGIEGICDSLPVVFNDCDHLFKSASFNEFCSKDNNDVDGLLLTFESNSDKYSYAGFDSLGNVIETKEKIVISNDAICGCYYFSSAELFKKMAGLYLDRCNYSEYFMSGVYNVMVENNLCVRCKRTDFHIPFGVPEEFDEAQKSNEYMELL